MFMVGDGTSWLRMTMLCPRSESVALDQARVISGQLRAVAIYLQDARSSQVRMRLCLRIDVELVYRLRCAEVALTEQEKVIYTGLVTVCL